MPDFFTSLDGFWSIQLDIVGFLAILGEASVLANGQVSAMSKTCLLPRLIPAPQALIRTSRPERLHPATGTVIGYESGNVKSIVNHVPHILHQVAYHEHRLGSAEPAPYTVRYIGLRWADHLADSEKNLEYAVEKASGRSKAGTGTWRSWAQSAASTNLAKRTGTWRGLGVPAAAAAAATAGRRESESAPEVKKLESKASGKTDARPGSARTSQFGPLVWLAYGGCLQSIALLALSCARRDGMSIIAVLLLSACSTLVGLASKWSLSLPSRTEDRKNIPPSDVVISYPNGSFLIVSCPEDIARLYTATEQCEYLITSVWQYRLICLVASMFLMIGVICLANATPLLQVMWAIMYIVLNAAYWIVAALPARWHWDMKSFETTAYDYSWTRYRKNPNGKLGPTETCFSGTEDEPGERNYTEALWIVVALTGASRWARTSQVAPATSGWDDWLKKAEEAARRAPLQQWNMVSDPVNGVNGQARNGTVHAGADDKSYHKSNTPQAEHDPESLIFPKTGKIYNGRKILPTWDYRTALTKCLDDYNVRRKRGSW